MIYTYVDVDGKTVKMTDLEYEKFLSFFVEEMFMKFMDSGRHGISAACNDFVDNTLYRIAQRQKIELTFNPAEANLKRISTRIAIDGFIKDGSTGLMDAARFIYQLVYNTFPQ